MKNTEPAYELIQKSLSSWVDGNKDDLALFMEITRPQLKTYRRKEIILHDGDVCQNLFFIYNLFVVFFLMLVFIVLE